MLFEWTVPPECPSEQAVTAQVAALAGEALMSQPLSVRARVTSGAEFRYRLELRVGSHDEDARVIENDECQKLADATALIVSLDLQAQARAERRKIDAAKPPAPVHPPAALAPAPTPTPAERKTHGGLGVQVSGDLGSLPKIAWGGGVFGYVRHGSFRGELGAALWPRSVATVDTSLGKAGASVSLRTVTLAGCMIWLRAFELSGCVRAEGGSARASGFGISRPATSEGAWFAAFVGLAARPFVWNGLAPRVTVELGTPLRYGAVDIERVGRVHAPSPVLFRFGIGVESELF